MTLHAKIHIGCKQLGIEEEDRRDLYERVTGKRSLTEMSPAEHQAVVNELKSKGFNPASRVYRKPLEGRFAPKLQALWIAAWNLGLTRNKTDQSLLAFVKRQSGVDHTRFLHHKEDADKVIEALKGWMARDGGVSWLKDPEDLDYQKTNGYKIALAQWHKLHLSDDQNYLEFDQYREFLKYPDQTINIPKCLDDFTEADWIPVMNALGRQIRAEK